MRVIHKTPIESNSIKDGLYPIMVTLPASSKLLTIQPQGGALYLWYEVETDEITDKAAFTLFCVGTGWGRVPNPGEGRYLCTAQHGGMVWHFYLPDEVK